MPQKIPLNNFTRFVLAFRDDGQLIDDATDTILTWDGVDTNTGGFIILKDGGIVIPPGIDAVQIYAQIIFESNATGQRIATVEKNGSRSFAGGSRDVSDGFPFDDTHLQILTAPLLVERGDVFRIEVFQDSGTTLEIDGSGSGRDSWFSIHALDLG